ncbi:MAG: hypothetical protein PT934_06970 [Peptoniphilaceae bacterium]|uniref:hypothetical protein n=1 Tax=Parvimonas sp. TaxID=1944660 RepID=UPI0025F0C1E0|nr:hypothetical protein [Parvimonas sp.]MCI5997421.1 hypothetical protein [Parvimonas sp.]MDD7765492.1 hypothetical protein [Peptoniphilaceae bacterium]MDY3051033.1 hypothetical protein [Parvimonas sp.]
MKDFNEQYENIFTKSIIRYGRFTNLFAIPLCFLPAIGLYVFYGAIPTLTEILTGWMYIASMFAVYSVVEPVSYFPLLGLPGTYMSFLSGNISNMRVPCSAIAQETLKVETGSKKAEIVSTLAIAGSIITNLIVVTIAALGGATLMSLFPPVVIEAFKYVSPAIFGAIFALYASKNLKYGAFALALTLIMLKFLSFIPLFLMIPIAIFGVVAFASFDEKMKNKN